MKYSPRFTYTFTPANGTLDLSAAANAFNIRGLLAVLNSTTAGVLYAAGTPGLGYAALSGGNVLTLQAPMTGMASTDVLQFIYDDGLAYGSVRSLVDGPRTIANLFTAAPVSCTATEALISLAGFFGTAAVAATTTPAVVSAGKTRRVQSAKLTFISTTTAGYAAVNLRFNAAGPVTLTSPVVSVWRVGANGPSTTTAGQIGIADLFLPMGLDLPAGSGFGLTVQGFGMTGTATANGFVALDVQGFEY